MALSEIDAICRTCSARFTAAGKHSFLGFRKLKCPSCGKDVEYPLTPGFRTAYWVVVVLMALAVSAALMQGKLAAPGIIGLAAVFALMKDARVKREVAEAEVSAAEMGPR